MRAIGAVALLLVLVVASCDRPSLAATGAGTRAQAVTSPDPTVGDAAYVQTVLADSPLGYWRLNETGGVLATDSSSNGLNGNISAPTTLAGAPFPSSGRSAMRFDGGFVRSTSGIDVGADFSVEAWVQAASLSQDAPVVSLIGPDSARVLYLQGEQFRGMADVTSDWPRHSVVSNTSVVTTDWHHVVLTIQGGSHLGLYVDGALVGSTNVAATGAFAANVVIGWSDDPGFRRFEGGLADVAVYPVALREDRIAAHAQAGRAILGATQSNCANTLQAAIDAAAESTVLKVPPCIYRETISLNKPLALDGQNNAEVRGSDVWSDWTSSGSTSRSTWTSVNTVPDFPRDSAGAEYTDSFRGSHLEQVFVDGAPLTIVPSNPGKTQFALDGARHVLLGTDPAGHTVEVTTRTKWAVTQADNVTITNLTFRHAASASQVHAIGNDDHANFVLSNSSLLQAHGIMVGIGGGDLHAKVLNNTLIDAGDLAIGSHRSGHALIQGNTITSSGWGGYAWMWQAGGMKFTAATDLTVDQNVVHGNGGPGIWCDIQCSNVTFSNNVVHDNFGPGLLFEISSGARIWGNAVWAQKAQGILLSDSSDAEVWGNTLAWNSSGISVVATQRADRPPAANANQYVHDNLIVMLQGNAKALEWVQGGQGKLFAPEAQNRGANNRYWYPVDEDDRVRFVWQRGFSRLADFNQTAGDSGGQYVTDGDRDSALTAAAMPITP